MGQAQAFPDERGPVLIGIVGQEVAAVEPARELVVTRRLVDFPCVFEPTAGFHAAAELIHVQPQPQLAADPVGTAGVHDHRDVGHGPKRPPQCVNGDVQAVPRGLGRRSWPEHLHEDLALGPGLPVREQVPEQRSAARAGPVLHRHVIDGGMQRSEQVDGELGGRLHRDGRDRRDRRDGRDGGVRRAVRAGRRGADREHDRPRRLCWLKPLARRGWLKPLARRGWLKPLARRVLPVRQQRPSQPVQRSRPAGRRRRAGLGQAGKFQRHRRA